ncbi:MAG TPA: matrixin family metalloprotease [Solirubrobacteraceae bacterium]|nr:matrixin family metalloprotease [Solirubrobacteraceae bacterium]
MHRPRPRHAATLAIGLAAGAFAIGIGPSAVTHAAAPVEGIAYSVSAPRAAAPAASPAADHLFHANDDGFTVNDVTGNAAADDAQFAVGSVALSDAETIAIHYWGGLPCNGNVDVSWQTLDPSVNGVASWWNPVAAYGNASANGNCSISMNLVQDYSWPMLCTVVTHEIGHLTGHDHVTDQTNVMYPVYVGPIAQCLAPPIGVPEPATAAAATASTSPTTVKAKAASHKKASHKHRKRTHKK